MKVAMIAGPYNDTSDYGVELNICIARSIMAKYLRLGYAVVCPHMNTAHMGGVIPEEEIYKMYETILQKVDTLILMENWRSSLGASREYNTAIAFGKEIIYD